MQTLDKPCNVLYLITPFTPEFLKWAHPSLHLDNTIVANRGLIKILKWQTLLFLMRWLVTSRLIWVYTVCKSVRVGLQG